MARTLIDGKQVENYSITKEDLNITGVLNGAPAISGLSVITKILEGTGVSFTSTGYDAGTGEVTVNVTHNNIAGLNVGDYLHLTAAEKNSFNNISSTYVPYTGATTSVNLGSQTLTTTGAVGTGALTSTTGNFSGILTGAAATFSGILTMNNYAQFNQEIYAYRAATNTVGAGAFFMSGGYTGFRTATNLSFNIDNYNGGSLINALTILQGGNVGIGVAGPAYKLDVNGTGNFSGALTGTSATFNGDVNVYQGRIGYDPTNSVFNYLSYDYPYYGVGFNTSLVGLSGYYGVALFTNTAERMRITSSGNVLIGTTTDAGYKLDVNGTGRFTGALTGTSATFNGSVGIGTTAPRTTLDVTGSAIIGANMLGYGTLSVERYAGAPYATLTLGDQTTPANAVGLYLRNNGTDPAGISTAGSPLAFFTSSPGSGEVMRILNNGNVGIGTTSPGAKLHVAVGNILLDNNQVLQAKNLSGTAYSLAGITSGNVIQIGAIDYISAGVTVAGGDNISFTTGGASGTKRMKILNTGEINIANGMWKFTSAGLFEWGNNRGYLTWDTGFAAIRTKSGNRLDLGTDASGIIMTLAENGNVGIGTTNPTAALHLKAGTASANTAPLKFTSGTNLTTAEAGAMEWDGTNLFVTQTSGPTRKTLAYTSDLGAYLKLDGSTTMTGNLVFSGTGIVKIGLDALNGNSGTYVVGIGFSAAANNTGNSINALGKEAGDGNIGNSVNALGNAAGYANTYSYVNIFGANATANATAQTVFSKDGTIMARLGYGGLSADRLYTLPDASGTVALVGGAGVGTVTSVAALTLGTTGTDLSSSVANGTTTPVITLNVPDASATARGVITTGTQTIAGAKTFSSALICSSNITATAYYQSSDLRLKNIISTQQSNDGIHTANFTLKSDGKEKWGYIAQEVKEVLPCAVSVSNDDMLTVDYTSVLVYKIAQLEKRIKELENR